MVAGAEQGWQGGVRQEVMGYRVVQGQSEVVEGGRS